MQTPDLSATATRSTPPNRPLTLLAGIGIGAALMYFLDPARGARRRHLVGDKALRAGRVAQREAADLADDARNRARGLVSETRGRLQDETLTDDQLVARVRAELGHHVEHARAIEVVADADSGTVTLRGPVLAQELPKIVATVGAVRGVSRVENQLDVQAAAGDAPRHQD